MAQNEIDPIDLAALILVPFMGAIALGTVTLQVNLLTNFSFNDVVWSGSGVSISYASLLTLAGIAWIVFTNELDGSNYEKYQFGVIIVAFAIVPAYMFIPFVKDFVDSSDIISFVLVIVQSASAIFVSYVE